MTPGGPRHGATSASQRQFFDTDRPSEASHQTENRRLLNCLTREASRGRRPSKDGRLLPVFTIDLRWSGRGTSYLCATEPAHPVGTFGERNPTLAGDPPCTGSGVRLLPITVALRLGDARPLAISSECRCTAEPTLRASRSVAPALPQHSVLACKAPMLRSEFASGVFFALPNPDPQEGVEFLVREIGPAAGASECQGGSFRQPVILFIKETCWTAKCTLLTETHGCGGQPGPASAPSHEACGHWVGQCVAHAVDDVVVVEDENITRTISAPKSIKSSSVSIDGSSQHGVEVILESRQVGMGIGDVEVVVVRHETCSVQLDSMRLEADRKPIADHLVEFRIRNQEEPTFGAAAGYLDARSRHDRAGTHTRISTRSTSFAVRLSPISTVGRHGHDRRYRPRLGAVAGW